MILRLASIRQTSIGCAPTGIPVRATRPPWHNGALHFLDCGHSGEGPEVGVGDPGELLLDWLEKVAGVRETRVSAVVALGGKVHGCAVGTAGVGFGVIAVWEGEVRLVFPVGMW